MVQKMESPSLTPSSRQPACIESERLGPSVITTIMSGYIVEEVCALQLLPFRKIVQATPHATWIIDVTRLTGFDARAVRAGAAWFTTFKQEGGERILYVSQDAPARMAAQALGFGAGINVKCFASMEQAVRQCRLKWAQQAQHY